MNLNKLAKRITLKEGKKINLSIAQVKEVLNITLNELSKERGSVVLRVLESRRQKRVQSLMRKSK